MKFQLLLSFFFVVSLAEDSEAGTYNSNTCRAFKATSTADTNFRYVKRGSHCYLFSKTEKHWTKAREFCKQKGADLVAINDEAENDFVHNMFHGDMAVPDYIAIGAMYDASLGWHWVANNEKITFSKWDGGAVPDQVGSSKYGAMYNSKESWGHWGDDNEPFVCEETAPDPCFGVNCLNGGLCKNGKCYCVDDYAGAHCQKVPNPCCGVNCLNGGKCENGNCNCVNGYTGARCETVPPVPGAVSFDSPAGNFLLFQHNTNGAKNPDGSYAFARTWADFSRGFGEASLNGKFYWRGLQTAHEWTKTGNWELMVRLHWSDNGDYRYHNTLGYEPDPSFRGKWGWRLYTGFRIGSEAEGFTFNVVAIKESANMPLKQTSGANKNKPAVDYLVSTNQQALNQGTNGMKFTTKDKDNDRHPSNCANTYKVGWWYNFCFGSDLNFGKYHGWSDGQIGRFPSETIMAIRQI